MENEDTVRGARPTDPAEGADQHDNPDSPAEQRKSVEQEGFTGRDRDSRES
ncbi:hypothetical protein [Amycolatopsis decaplanina]|uniref:hypothetical protein n=1 Tax=Amycolatopsis decaplanina TaxID=208441 RepID=UPI00034C292F|nr:hypothetical protein [Amycolatopsis decaplanina]